jgi:hypothetical protein
MVQAPPDGFMEVRLLWADWQLPQTLQNFVDAMISETYVTEIGSIGESFRVNWRHVTNAALKA